MNVGQQPYEIRIAPELLARAGRYLSDVLPSKKICVVTDETVAKLYLVKLMKDLEGAGFTCTPPVILPPGEETKNFVQLQAILDKCLSFKLDRKSTILALGGGVVGDIAGFAASILLRGVPFVQIPTTLLAQVDSSVGGKTAINSPHGKNLIGTFYQPKLVLIDTETLKTLPLREIKSGYAEVLKYALIDRPAFFDWLDKNGMQVMSGEGQGRAYAVTTCCQAKAALVAADEKEQKDVRALLNLGHTFGHALEVLGGYDGRILHGEAVGLGMDMAFALSCRLKLCPEKDLARLKAHMATMGLMTKLPFKVTAAEMLARMQGDKKNQGGQITLILAKGIGKAFVAKNVDERELTAFLEGYLNGL